LTSASARIAAGEQKKVFPPRRQRWGHGKKFFRRADSVGNTEKSFYAPPTTPGTRKNVFPPRRQRWEHRKKFLRTADNGFNNKK
jgi:hypothetical protein